MNICENAKLLMWLSLVGLLNVIIAEPVGEYRLNDDITKAEITALKTMLTSVQGSLITSVGLIQGTLTLCKPGNTVYNIWCNLVVSGVVINLHDTVFLIG